MFDFLRNASKTAAEKRQETIAAYLDDELTSRQRREFETRLAQDSVLQGEVEQQRHIKLQLSRLPRRPVPRNFMLDPAAYGRPQPQPWLQLYPVLRTATVVTAFFFILAVATDLFTTGSPGLTPASQAPLAGERAAEVAELPLPAAQEEAVAEQEIVETEALELAAEEPVTEAVVVEEAPAAAEDSAAGESLPSRAEADQAPAAAGEATVPALFGRQGVAAAATPAARATPAPTSTLPAPTPTLPAPALDAAASSTALAETAVAQADAEIAAVPAKAVEPAGGAPEAPAIWSIWRWLALALGLVFILLAGAALLARRLSQ